MISWEELLSYQAHPDVWLLVGGLASAYVWCVRRRVHTTSEKLDIGSTVSFLGGLLLMWLAADWPVDDVGEQSLLSVHMFQYLLLAMIVPALLLRGIPAWLMEQLLPRGPLRSAARIVSRPLVAWAIVTVVLLGTHWNPVIELYLTNDIVHLAMHVAWVGSGLCLWLPVLSPLEDVPRLTPPAQIGYLFLQSVPSILPASFLTFAEFPVFAAYGRLPKPPGIDAVLDQQIAGLLMKLGGGAILWTAITIVFFRWSAAEEHRRPDRTKDDVGQRPAHALPSQPVAPPESRSGAPRGCSFGRIAARLRRWIGSTTGEASPQVVTTGRAVRPRRCALRTRDRAGAVARSRSTDPLGATPSRTTGHVRDGGGLGGIPRPGKVCPDRRSLFPSPPCPAPLQIIAHLAVELSDAEGRVAIATPFWHP